MTALALSPAPVTQILRVLVVDDDDGMRRTVARSLRRLGCDVDVEADTPSALLRLRDASYDLVLSDVSMPLSTGIDLLRAVHGEKPELPVALMTGGGHHESAIEAVNAGAFSYLTKPFDERRLQRLLDKVATARQRLASEQSALA
jgi:DNA-binding NtrC family response regulator